MRSSYIISNDMRQGFGDPSRDREGATSNMGQWRRMPVPLWSPCGSQAGPVRREVGVRLFSADEIPEAHALVISQYRETLESLLNHNDVNVARAARDDLDNWLPNLLVVGQMLRWGDYIALDYRRDSAVPGEKPLVFLDHELLAMGSCDLKTIADSMAGFLVQLIDSPFAFLEWRCRPFYSDRQGYEWWTPVEYRPVQWE